MFSIKIVEVGIGLAFTYLIVSTASSGLLEAWKLVFMNLKAKHLRLKLAEMFGKDGKIWVDKLYEHPMISSFFKEQLKGVSCIEAKDMTMAMMDMLMGVGDEAEQDSVGKLKAAVKKEVPEGDMKQRMMIMIEHGGDNMENVKAMLDEWFDRELKMITTMYVNYVRRFLTVIAIAIVVGFNLDTLEMGRTFWVDEELRLAIVSASDEWVSTHSKPDTVTVEKTVFVDSTQTDSLKPKLASVVKVIDKAGAIGGELIADSAARVAYRNQLANVREAVEAANVLPIGWNCDEVSAALAKDKWGFILLKALGLIITVGAVVVGAPYWYDIMRSLINLRSLIKSVRGSDEKPQS